MGSDTPWWEKRRALVLLSLAMAIPLIWPTVPPLTDLPGHMGRYAVQIGLQSDPVLGRWFDFKWALIGNLGFDLLVQLFAPLFGLEPTVKAIAMAVPVLTAAGMLLIAREVHGRVPPSALFALPLSFAFPFQFGFINFSLSVAFAMLLFALWLRLTRLKQWRLRAALFIPGSFLLWLTHTYGWGLLGLMVGGSEVFRLRDEKRGWLASLWGAALSGLMLAGPAVLLLIAPKGDQGQHTGFWFQWDVKLEYLISPFRDRWRLFDVLTLAATVWILVRAMLAREYRWNRRLGLVAALLILAFILMPRVLLHSAYADMRLVPIMLAMAILGIAPLTNKASARKIAKLGLALVLIRLVGSTASMAMYDQRYTQALGAIDHIPRHARVLALVGKQCQLPWHHSRLDHVPALAIVRRHAFVNDQWAFTTAQLLNVTKSDAPGFIEDPSQMTVEEGCKHPLWMTTNTELDQFPRQAFDYLWIIEPNPFDHSRLNGLERVWTNGRDSLYRIPHPRQPGSRPQ